MSWLHTHQTLLFLCIYQFALADGPPSPIFRVKKNAERRNAGRASKKPGTRDVDVRCRMISSHLYWPKPSISGLLQGGVELGGRRQYYPTDFLAQTPCKLCWIQWYHWPNSYTRSNLISRPKPDSIDETKWGKPHLQAATVNICYFFPRIKCGR